MDWQEVLHIIAAASMTLSTCCRMIFSFFARLANPALESTCQFRRENRIFS